MAIHVRGVVLPDDEVRDLWLVGDRVTLDPVPGAETVSTTGFILPGLVDAHCHIGIRPGGGPIADLAEAKTLAAIDRAAGVLAIRDAGSPYRYPQLDDDPDVPRGGRGDDGAGRGGLGGARYRAVAGPDRRDGPAGDHADPDDDQYPAVRRDRRTGGTEGPRLRRAHAGTAGRLPGGGAGRARGGGTHPRRLGRRRRDRARDGGPGDAAAARVGRHGATFRAAGRVVGGAGVAGLSGPGRGWPGRPRGLRPGSPGGPCGAVGSDADRPARPGGRVTI